MSVLHLLKGPGMESRVELFAAIRRDARMEGLSIREFELPGVFRTVKP